MKMLSPTPLCLAILFLGTAHAGLIEEAEAIRQARLEQNDALAKGDVEWAARFWTEDITLRRGLGSSVMGKEAYRALIETTPHEKSLIYVREPDCIEVSPAWPLAYESGTWSGRRGSAEGPIGISGRYAAQWVKREGFWLIRSEIFVALTCAETPCAGQALP